jgi:hypothetical protein
MQKRQAIMQNRKELFRKLINEQVKRESPIKAAEHNPDILIKKECSHRECAGLSKCSEDRNYNGIDY